MNLKRFEHTFNKVSSFGNTKKGLNRLAYTEEEQKALTYLKELLELAQLEVRIDVVGNLIARREGKDPSLPVIACGSHLDSVYAGGNFDGTMGVIAALEVILSLNDEGIETDHPIELIIFACEESARFGVSMIGSKAMTGLIPKEGIGHLKDKNGTSIKEAFKTCGLDYKNMELAKRSESEFKVFLELHIEQGPVLERQEKQIGIVTGIASPTRYKVQVIGEAAHSGSTPMPYRKDAFSGVAEIALAIEKTALLESNSGTVATVGVCEIIAGAMNVVPGKIDIGIDIRSISEKSKQNVIEVLYARIKQIEEERDLTVHITELCNETPVQMDATVIQSLIETCDRNGFSYFQLPSGGGHDAMNMAHICQTGLIFIPSREGISHNPKEYSSLEQIKVGILVLKEEILNWAHRT